VGVNTTLMSQEPEAGKDAPQAVVPVDVAKSPAFGPDTPITIPFRATGVLLVSVTVCALEATCTN